MIHQLCASVTLCMESAHASLLLSRCSVDSFVLFRLKLCGTIRKLGLLCRGIANKNKVKAKHYWTLIAFHHKGNNQFPSEASCAGDGGAATPSGYWVAWRRLCQTNFASQNDDSSGFEDFLHPFSGSIHLTKVLRLRRFAKLGFFSFGTALRIFVLYTTKLFLPPVLVRKGDISHYAMFYWASWVFGRVGVMPDKKRQAAPEWWFPSEAKCLYKVKETKFEELDSTHWKVEITVIADAVFSQQTNWGRLWRTNSAGIHFSSIASRHESTINYTQYLKKNQ